MYRRASLFLYEQHSNLEKHNCKSPNFLPSPFPITRSENLHRNLTRILLNSSTSFETGYIGMYR